MAIRYAVDLIDTERATLREIISKNKAKRSTIISNSRRGENPSNHNDIPVGVS
jgi:hypothetical protein